MDRIHYDVSVTNVASSEVIFPWSAVPIHRRDRPETGYRHAYFELTVKRDGHEDWVIATAVLYGAPNVPNSLRVIRPGDTVIIRLPGILAGGGYQDARNPVLYPDPSVSVAVQISLAAPPTLERLYAVSENALPMTILPAEAQDK